MTKKVITFGEIMLRLSPPEHQRLGQAAGFEIAYGGGESNVAASLARFGLPAAFVTRLPANDLGECAMAELRRWGVGTEHVRWGGRRLGIYFYEKGAGHRPGKVLYDRAQSSMADIAPGMFDWENIFGDARWFHWTGITPAISQGAADACREAVAAAGQQGVPVSFDLSYRAALWQYGKQPAEILPGLAEGCDLILCGPDDAARHLGIPPGDGPEGHRLICEKLMARFPKAKKIVLTLRRGGEASGQEISAVLFDGSVLHESPAFRIAGAVDRVGSGDAFAAGLIYGLLTFGDDARALHFAAAAACLKHSFPGDVNLARAEEVEALMMGQGGGGVKR